MNGIIKWIEMCSKQWKRKSIQKKYHRWMKEMEEDSKNHDFSVPADWDQDFRRTIEETLCAKEGKNKNRVGKTE